MSREGETPARIFWHIGVQKKWYKLSKLGGGGRVEGNLDKIQKNSNFFIVKPSLMAPESVMICWQERHIWPWQPLLQETEMVDGWSLGQLRQKISLYFLLLCSF